MGMSIDYFHNYKIGVDFIDKEHYNLFVLCDEIYQSISDEKRSLHLLSNFNEAVKIHFKSEEEFMGKINFPYMKFHIEAHANILTKLNEFLENKNKYDVYKQKYLLKTLDDCLLKHIDHYDTQIGTFLKNQNK